MENKQNNEIPHPRRDSDLEGGDRFRTLRCFCGCSSFTHEQIEHIATMNVVRLLNHKIGIDLFRNFLRIGCRTDTSEVLMLMDCYNLCDKIIKNVHIIQEPEIQNDLLNLCPTYVWEERLKASFHKKQDEMLSIMNDLKQECVQSVECHNDYDRFRRELLRKIHRNS